MFIFSKKIISITILVIAILNFNFVFAQVTTQTDQTSSVDMNINPSNPKAWDKVQIQLSSYSINLDTSKITWYIDNVSIKEGTGIKSLNMQTKNSGDVTKIRAVIETTDGIVTEVAKEISTAGVDLVVEPTSYTTPFYQGKPLFAAQGVVRIVAIPDVATNGKKISSKNLIFQWKKDDVILQSSSGVGRDSLIITGSVPIKDINISVQIMNSSGGVLASASKILTVNDPKILFYENSPLYGVLFNKAIINNYYLGQKEEVNILAKPFFFNTKSDISSELAYKWSVNGNPISTDGKVNELTLRQPTTNLKGTASISLDLNNVTRIFQFTNAGFNISFGQ